MDKAKTRRVNQWEGFGEAPKGVEQAGMSAVEICNPDL
jgi:hypothetical protein